MSFTNLYYKRTAGTPKACYICYRPTTTVLATANTVDFLYSCDNHLTDPGFATSFAGTTTGSSDGASAAAAGARKMGLSDEEIRQVKEEWEENQRRKKEREAAKEKEKEKDKETEKDKDKDETENGKEKKGEGKKITGTLSPLSSPSSPPTPVPTHQRFTLHRQIFAMRLAAHRKRRQTSQAKEIAPRLPSAPRGAMPGGL